jgi:hypothetical protein
MLSHSLALFSAAMFVLGLVSGITMSIGTFLVPKCTKVASAVPACCLLTPSSAWPG